MQQQGEDREIDALLQRSMFEQALPAWYLSLGVSCVTVAYFFGRVDEGELVGWASAAVFILGFRLGLILKCRGKLDGPLPIVFFTILMGLTGLLWGSVVMLLDPRLDQADQLVIALMPVIVSLGVIVTLGNWPACYQAFIGGVVIAVLFFAYDFADNSSWRLLVPLLLIISGCLYCAHRFHQQTRENLFLRLRNQRALQSKDEFLARMSHELRTPMNGVLGMVRMLSKTPLTDEQQHLVATLSESGEDMLGLVSDLLDAASLASHDVDLIVDDSDLREITREVVEAFYRKIQQRPISLDLKIDDEFPDSVVFDAQRWRQICQKLLGNALKFTEQGRISVNLCFEEESLVLSIRDTGCGIPESQVDTVRQQFHQVQGDCGRRAGGAGIGLTIVQGLIDLMDGSLLIESELGRGTVVTVRVPLIRSEAAVDGSAKLSEDTAGFADSSTPGQSALPDSDMPVRALVAEDNPVNQLVIEAVLDDLGCDITVVENGLEALLALQASSYDIIFMDCQMPELDGFEATRQARENGCTIPIIAVTANALSGDRERCLEAGMNDYVTKPFAEDALQQMIDKWLQNRRSKSLNTRAA